MLRVILNVSAEELMRCYCDSLGIPDTSLRGLSTRTARSVRRSKSEPTVARILQAEQQQLSEKQSKQRQEAAQSDSDKK